VFTQSPQTWWLWLTTVTLLVSCHRESAESKNSPSRARSDRVESHSPQDQVGAANSFEAVLERTDEAGVLALLDQQFASRSFDSKTKYYFYRLARLNPALAVQKLEEGFASDKRSLFALMAPSVILELCKNHATDKAFEWVATHPEIQNSGDWLPIAEWVAKHDRAQGMAMAVQLSGYLREELLRSCMVESAKIDIDAAFAEAQRLVEPNDRQIALANIAMVAVMNKDFGRAIAIAGSLETANKSRLPLLATLMTEWFATDRQAAMKQVAALAHADKVSVLNSPNFKSVVFGNGPAAEGLSLLGGVTLTNDTSGLFNTYCVEFSKEDPKAVMDFLSGLSTSHAKGAMVNAVFAAMAARDPDAAMTWVDSLGAGSRTMAVRGIAKTLAPDHLDQALAIAAGEQGAAAQDTYREIARTSAYQRPANAVRMLEDPVISEKLGADFRPAMLDNTVQTWAKQDLPAAQQWVGKLPAADAPKGVQGLMTTWMKSDPVAASAWLSNQPTGPARDAGARVVIEQIKDTDPEMAEQWRKTLPPAVPK
jgi:hypothetical protein